MFIFNYKKRTFSSNNNNKKRVFVSIQSFNSMGLSYHFSNFDAGRFEGMKIFPDHYLKGKFLRNYS